MEFDALLATLAETNAADLILIAGQKPRLKHKTGLVLPLETQPVIEPQDIKDALLDLANAEALEEFEKKFDYELSFGRGKLGRFRATFYHTLSGPALVIRSIPNRIPRPDELEIPQVIQNLALRPDGLILITGPNGHGKSTTLASLIQHINENRNGHIVTIEDPIEFTFEPAKSVFSQRDIGVHAESFPDAIRHTLRQAVDVIVVGEMRDRETISTALTLAETGHLVLATLHTHDAPRTVQRIIDVFPPEQQDQIALQLSFSLTAVVSQRLLPRADGSGRVAAREIMIANDGIRNAIRQRAVSELYSQIQINREAGMITFDDNLLELVRSKVITADEALLHAHEPQQLRKHLGA